MSLTRYVSLSKLNRIRSNKYLYKRIPHVNFSLFDFLDQYTICTVSGEDDIYVYDLRRGQRQQKKRQIFRLDLPPINRNSTSRYIQLRRNALPIATGPLPDWGSLLDDSDIAPGPANPPFHADPHERLIVVRISTSPVESGEENFELHVPARALLDHFSSSATTADTGENRQMDDGGVCKDEEEDWLAVSVPWTAWRDAVHATPLRKLPYVGRARMVVHGMRVVSHPPDWDEGVMHVDSYLPRARREGSRDAGADTRAEAAEAEPAAGVAGARRYGTRQAIRLPQEEGGEVKPDFLTTFCEDAILCYKVNYRIHKLGFILSLQYRMPDLNFVTDSSAVKQYLACVLVHLLKMGNGWVVLYCSGQSAVIVSIDPFSFVRLLLYTLRVREDHFIFPCDA